MPLALRDIAAEETNQKDQKKKTKKKTQDTRHKTQ